MIEDNGGVIASILLNKDAHFNRVVFGGKAYYQAGNRAARRALLSAKFKSKAKEYGLKINEEDMTVC